MLANGIEPEFLVIGCFAPLGLPFCIPLLEAVVGRLITGLRVRQTYWVWFVANTISALGGLVILLSFGGVFAFWEFVSTPHDVGSGISRAAPRLAIYFIETVLVEALVWWAALRTRPALRSRRWLAAVIASNIVSYSLLIPLLAVGLSARSR